MYYCWQWEDLNCKNKPWRSKSLLYGNLWLIWLTLFMTCSEHMHVTRFTEFPYETCSSWNEFYQPSSGLLGSSLTYICYIKLLATSKFGILGSIYFENCFNQYLEMERACFDLSIGWWASENEIAFDERSPLCHA